MRPAVTVLQLDTRFPRVAGDVGCPETYINPIEILRVDGAFVSGIVRKNPERIDIAPFEYALRQARGDIVVTSCGFLSYWQEHLERLSDRPFISSALNALPSLVQTCAPADIMTVTFDAQSLNPHHFGEHQTNLVGLSLDMHLRQVIANDLPQLDTAKAEVEIVDLITAAIRPHHKHILLECTNLPPYRRAIAQATGLPITDILSCIEDRRPGSIQPEFLGPRRSPSQIL